MLLVSLLPDHDHCCLCESLMLKWLRICHLLCEPYTIQTVDSCRLAEITVHSVKMSWRYKCLEPACNLWAVILTNVLLVIIVVLNMCMRDLICSHSYSISVMCSETWERIWWFYTRTGCPGQGRPPRIAEGDQAHYIQVWTVSSWVMRWVY